MEMSKKQVQFWTFMLVIVLLTAVVILGIDFAIKGAILEESTRLRGMLEDEERRRNGLKAGSNGTAAHVPNHDPFSGDVLGVFPPGMEKGSSGNGSAPSPKPVPKKASPRRSKPASNTDTPDFPSGN